MPILFRCPCGRSMVADSAKAGALIRCPNCHRTLRVPSGKDRGKELASPAAAKAQTTRVCERCGRSIPVDAQMCPHCKAIQTEEAEPSVPPAAAPAAKADVAIIYGGSRATWWSQLSSGAKVAILMGTVLFAAAVGLLVRFVVYPSWHAKQVAEARSQAQQALKEGRELENQGTFQQAYDRYFSARDKANTYLKATGIAGDRELAERLQARTRGLQYIIPSPQTRESLRWRARSQTELDHAQAELNAMYPAYRQRVLAVADAALAAVQTARSDSSHAAFTDQIGRTIDAFIELSHQTTPQQRAQWSFSVLVEAIRDLTDANRNWDANREAGLGHATQRLEFLKELVHQPPGTAMGDKIRGT